MQHAQLFINKQVKFWIARKNDSLRLFLPKWILTIRTNFDNYHNFQR